MKQRHKQLAALLVLVAALAGLVVLLVLPGFQTPYVAVDELKSQAADLAGQDVRLAGVVAAAPQVDTDGAATFPVEARGQSVEVVYRGALPPNLAVGVEALLDGRLDATGRFHADRVYTRCSSRERQKLQ